MSDIIERLRATPETGADPDLIFEAADEIERLRGLTRNLRDVIVSQNRFGASWHPDIFGKMMAALADSESMLGKGDSAIRSHPIQPTADDG